MFLTSLNTFYLVYKVQRCLQKGDAVSGVTVLFTVLKMDAGPIIAQHQEKLSGYIFSYFGISTL